MIGNWYCIRLGMFFNLNSAWEGIISLVLGLKENTDNNVVINFNSWLPDYSPDYKYALFAQGLKAKLKSNPPNSPLHFS